MQNLKYFLLFSALTSLTFSAESVKQESTIVAAKEGPDLQTTSRANKRERAESLESSDVEESEEKTTVVVIEDGVKSIEEMAYAERCITELRIPASLTEIKKAAFSGAYPTILTGEPKLLDLSHTNLNTIGESAFFSTKLLFSVVVLPSTVKVVEKRAFSSGPKLIVIPASMDEELKKQLREEYNKKDCNRDAVTIIEATGR